MCMCVCVYVCVNEGEGEGEGEVEDEVRGLEMMSEVMGKGGRTVNATRFAQAGGRG